MASRPPGEAGVAGEAGAAGAAGEAGEAGAAGAAGAAAPPAAAPFAADASALATAAAYAAARRGARSGGPGGAGRALEPLHVGDVVYIRDDGGADRAYLSADALGRDVVFRTTTRGRAAPDDFRQSLWRVAPRLAYDAQAEEARLVAALRGRAAAGEAAARDALGALGLAVAGGAPDEYGDGPGAAAAAADAAAAPAAAARGARRRAALERAANARTLAAVAAGALRTPVVYGAPVQLQHVLTGHFLCGEDEPADVEDGAFRLSLRPPRRACAACAVAIRPGFRARGDGTPVYVGDEPRFTVPALTLNAAHPATLRRSGAALPAEPPRGGRRLEANLALDADPRFFLGKFAERAPSDAGDEVDVGQHVRLMHREDDSLLVASANSGAKQRAARAAEAAGERGDARRGEPYLRHMSRKKDSPGKGLWLFELEDPTRGGPLLHGARVRLRHACSGLYLAVRYAADPAAEPSRPELVSLGAGRDARARSLFGLRSVKESRGGAVPAAGYACLVTHEIRGARGARGPTLCLRAGCGKPGKAHSARVVFCPRASIMGAMEVHVAVGDEADRLQVLLAAREAVRRHARLVADVGASPPSPRTARATALATRHTRARLRASEYALVHVVYCLVRGEALDGDGRSAATALALEGPPHGDAQSLAREVKLLDALVALVHAVPAAGVRLDLDASTGEAVDPRFGYLVAAHRLAYAALTRAVLAHARNEDVFVAGKLPGGGPGWLDVVISQIVQPVGAPELLTCLVSNNVRLISRIVDAAMVRRFAGFVAAYGPRADLLGFLAATCASDGRAVPAIQELVFAQVVADPRVKAALLLETSNDVGGDTARRPWPLARAPPASGRPFLAAAQLEAGFRPIHVRWRSEAGWAPGRGAAAAAAAGGALFHGPAALGLESDGHGWVLLRDLAVYLDDAAYARAVGSYGADPGDVARAMRLRQLAAYYVGQVELLAELCRDRSYNAIAALEAEYTFGMCLWAVVNGGFPGRLRAAFATLLLHLHVVKYPHQRRCGQAVLPQRAWVAERLVARDDAFDVVARFDPAVTFPDADVGAVAFSADKFHLLKVFVAHYLDDGATQVMVADEPSRTLVTLKILDVVEALVDFGFYSNAADLRALLVPLFRVLDGGTDLRSRSAPPRAAGAPPPTLGLARDGGPGAALLLEAKTCIVRVLGAVWDVLGQCVVHSALTAFRELRDAAPAGGGAAAPPRAAAAKPARGARVAPAARGAPDAARVAARFLALFDGGGAVAGCDVVALCGVGDGEMDAALRFLSHHEDDDLLREVLAFGKRLRCPRAWLLDVLRHCVLIDAGEAAHVHAYLAARAPGRAVAAADAVPRLASMACELGELANRGEVWLRAGAAGDGQYARVVAILGAFGDLLAPSGGAALAARHQAIFLKIGLEKPLLACLLNDDVPAGDDATFAASFGRLVDFRARLADVIGRFLVQHPAAQELMVPAIVDLHGPRGAGGVGAIALRYVQLGKLVAAGFGANVALAESLGRDVFRSLVDRLVDHLDGDGDGDGDGGGGDDDDDHRDHLEHVAAPPRAAARGALARRSSTRLLGGAAAAPAPATRRGLVDACVQSRHGRAGAAFALANALAVLVHPGPSAVDVCRRNQDSLHEHVLARLAALPRLRARVAVADAPAALGRYAAEGAPALVHAALLNLLAAGCGCHNVPNAVAVVAVVPWRQTLWGLLYGPDCVVRAYLRVLAATHFDAGEQHAHFLDLHDDVLWAVVLRVAALALPPAQRAPFVAACDARGRGLAWLEAAVGARAARGDAAAALGRDGGADGLGAAFRTASGTLAAALDGWPAHLRAGAAAAAPAPTAALAAAALEGFLRRFLSAREYRDARLRDLQLMIHPASARCFADALGRADAAGVVDGRARARAREVLALALGGAAQESDMPNFKGSDLGRVPLVSADFWTSDRLSERSRSVDAFSGTRARGTLTLKRRWISLVLPRRSARRRRAATCSASTRPSRRPWTGSAAPRRPARRPGAAPAAAPRRPAAPTRRSSRATAPRARPSTASGARS